MTRIDEAAKTLTNWVDSEGGMEAIARNYDGDLTGAVEALGADGHLAPDLPEPDRTRSDLDWRDEYADEWDSDNAPDMWRIGETWVGSLGVFPGAGRGVTVWADMGEPYEPISPYVARKMAYALLAAADYAERNQE